MGVADDPHRIFAVGEPAGQERVILQHCADPDHDPGQVVPQFLHMGPRLLPCHPFGKAGIGGDLAVQGHGVFHDHIGCSGRNIVKKNPVGLVTSRFQDTLRHLDAMLPQDPDAAARHFGIGICTSHDDAADPRLQDRFCTWRLFAVVAAGLQGDVHGRAHRGFPRFPAVFQSVPLRMQISVTFMAALPDHRPVRPDNDSSHHRVGGGAAPPFFGQVKGHAHIVLVHFHKLYLPPVR